MFVDFLWVAVRAIVYSVATRIARCTGSRYKRAKQRADRHHTSVQYQLFEPRKMLSSYFPAYINDVLTLGDVQSPAPYGYANTFKLESRPSATKTIYLDFTGHYSTNNGWNHSINFPRYDRNGNARRFSNAELIEIQKIFQNVAEDFIPFNVNVTTKNPPVSDLIKSGGNDNRFGVRAILTQPTAGFGNGLGGTAILNSFDDAVDNPVFIFSKGANNAAIIASHEVGHALGLNHDGYNSEEYHAGVGRGKTSWGPIMGAPYYKHLTQWSNGEYPGANNGEDDLAVITREANGFGFRRDDTGNRFRSASHLNPDGDTNIFDWGVIGRRGDVDVYKFQTQRGPVALGVYAFGENPNLKIKAQLHDARGQLVATKNPSDNVNAVFNLNLERGTYFLTVDGVGTPRIRSDYGSLGFYTIRGAVAEGVRRIGESGFVNLLNHNWKTVELQHRYNDPVVIVGPSSIQGVEPATVRVRNVTSRSFQVKIDEWDYLDGLHANESVGYLVVEAGTHVLRNGALLIAQNSWVNHEFRQIGFGRHFPSRPVVLSQTVTANGTSAVTTRIRLVETGGFKIRLQEEESNNGQHNHERVAWLAIETGTLQDGGTRLEAANTADRITHRPSRINFDSDFGRQPVFLAGIQTYHGTNPAVVRRVSLNRDLTRIFAEEERSADQEVSHTTEVVGYVALTAGDLFALLDPVRSPLPSRDKTDQLDRLAQAGDFGDETEDWIDLDDWIQQSWQETALPLGGQGGDDDGCGCTCSNCVAAANEHNSS